jgi:hypothetical protein
LEKLAKKSTVGPRLAILNEILEQENHKHKVERLRLLASFLDDVTVRDQSFDKRSEGICAAFLYEKIQVRNFVALRIARQFGLETAEKKDRTDAELAEIRETVQTKLKQELGAMKK